MYEDKLKEQLKLIDADNRNLQIENKYLKDEVERLNTIIANIHNYIEKMSYCEVVDNPKKELSRILEKGE